MTPEALNKLIADALQESPIIPWWTYILFIILPFLGGYIGSYTKKKAENLATKEDIKEITEKIESVKSEIYLSKELEKQYLDKKLTLLMVSF